MRNVHSVDVTVDVDLDDILAGMTDDEVNELVGDRAASAFGGRDRLAELYAAFTANKRDQVDAILREVFYSTLGRIA